MSEKMTRPDDLLPLTPAVFHILLTLGDGKKHGYAIMQDVSNITNGQVTMGPGTLYGSIKRMLGLSLIEEIDTPEGEDDPRRRYYQLTPFGNDVAIAEARRLTRLIQVAQHRKFLANEG